MDLFPTLLEFAGVPLSDSVDGKSITDTVLSGGKSPHDSLFWEMDGQTAIRKGQYKLVLNGVLVEDGLCEYPVFLSNLIKDPSESENLAEALPELTSSMKAEAEAWRKDLEAYWDSIDFKAV